MQKKWGSKRSFYAAVHQIYAQFCTDLDLGQRKLGNWEIR